MTTTRCAAASLARDEPAYGTASTFRGFLLVEYAGAWGREALVDSRLSEPVKSHLRETAQHLGIKVLLIRRHGRGTHRGTGHRVFAAYADPVAPWLETTTLRRYEELAELELAPLREGRSLGLTPHPGPLLLTCTHGRHDSCCAERGRPVAKALADAHPDHAWEVSHIGGDRFAGNVVVLPHGLYYGRVDADSVPELAARQLAGHLSLESLRGRSGYPVAVQAAEWFLRDALAETALDALRLEHRRRRGDEWEVDFAVAGRLWRVRLRIGRRDPERLTCAAERLSPAPAFDLVSLREVRSAEPTRRPEPA